MIIQLNFRHICALALLCSGMFKWTAVNTHRIIVKREDESMENVPRTSGSGFQEWYCGSPDVAVLAILSVSPLKVNCSHATPVQCRWAFLSARWFQGYSQAESVFFLSRVV